MAYADRSESEPSRMLSQLLERSAARWPEATAIEEAFSGASITYRGLSELSDLLAGHLGAVGVRPGDRIGICLRKSIDAVAAIFGTLGAGAAYVPVDPYAPPSRNAYIFKDCGVKAVIVEHQFVRALRSEMLPPAFPRFLTLDGVGGGQALSDALDGAPLGECDATASTKVQSSDLAYILYTSGSTGRPKGVMLTHENALSFIDWCSQTFRPTEQDRFSSHAPFHFDLSIFDLFVSIKHGAMVVLIDDVLGKNPSDLARCIAERGISIWYSVPSILALLAEYGKLDRYDYSALRMVLFAGEVFPIRHLKTLKALLPGAALFNLYGPTETNVCTYYEIPHVVPKSRGEPFPIGKPCSHLTAMLLDGRGSPVPGATEGELCVSGPAVMTGYWNLPEENDRAFLEAAGKRWYRTGDLVKLDEEGNYVFLGRRDRMVKRRGYRIELGEIEAGIYRHPGIAEAAVIALRSEDSSVNIHAFVRPVEGKKLSVIDLKRFCVGVLPSYMIPDRFFFETGLPKTSTGKIDYQRLAECASERLSEKSA